VRLTKVGGMTITFSVQFSALMVVAFSLFCLMATTAFCWVSGLFDGNDPWGIGWMFGLIFYCCGWVVPSLVAWATWATWQNASN
jgi:hypothetical protein